MNWVFSLTLLASLLGSSAIEASERLPKVCQTTQDFSKNLAFCISHYDSLGNSKWRSTVPGGFRTTLGMQFDPSCLEKSEEKLKEQKKNLELNITKAFNDILNCEREYPELRPYTLQWISQARRGVIGCVKEYSIELNARGFNDPGKVLPNIRKYRSRIVLARDVIEEYSSQLSGSDTLIHEFFHSTEANNKENHSSVEQKEIKDGQICRENKLDDRVNTLGLICTRLSAVSRIQKTEEIILMERMNRCGNKRGCEDLFTTSYSGSDIDFYIPSYPLSSKSAKVLCNRIYENGFCSSEVRNISSTSKKLEAFFRSFPTYRRLMREVDIKLDRFRVKDNRIIPKDWLDSNPEQTHLLKKLSSTRCYKSVFINEPRTDNALLFRAGKTHVFSDDEFKLPFLFSVEFSSHLETQDCNKDSKTRRSLQSAFEIMSADFLRLSEKYFDEENPSIDAFRFSWNPSEWKKKEMKRIFGDILTDELIRFHKRFSPESPYFDCHASGLALRATANLVGHTLKQVQTMQPQRSCP